ncbi:MAG: response regulator transcription factor [Gammaproteobacteria bacterium]|nr:response regulator transcription factor [Gammaproteobacteria bacterium]
MNKKTIIHIIDDDEAVRESLKLVIRSADYEVVTYHSAEIFLKKFKPESAGCLLLDIRMPGMSGLELQALLPTLHIYIPVIVMTGYGDVPTAVRAMKAGAMDFIEKPYNHDQLLNRIDACVNDAKSRETLAQQLKGINRVELLTPREREVMTLLVDGKINKVIAAELGISTRTVEAHRANLMEKLQAKSLSDIVRISVLRNKQLISAPY